MDFFKWLIVTLALALVGLGIFTLDLAGRVSDGYKRFEAAKEDVVQVHAIGEQLRALVAMTSGSKRRDDLLDPGVYFQNQLSLASIHRTRYSVNQHKSSEVAVPVGRRRKLKAVDRPQEIKILTGNNREKLFVTRNQLFRALYYCEAKSKRWRLQQLKIRAQDDVERGNRKKNMLPETLVDRWQIEKLVFVAREPKQ